MPHHARGSLRRWHRVPRADRAAGGPRGHHVTAGSQRAADARRRRVEAVVLRDRGARLPRDRRRRGRDLLPDRREARRTLDRQGASRPARRRLRACASPVAQAGVPGASGHDDLRPAGVRAHAVLQPKMSGSRRAARRRTCCRRSARCRGRARWAPRHATPRSNSSSATPRVGRSSIRSAGRAASWPRPTRTGSAPSASSYRSAAPPRPAPRRTSARSISQYSS